MLSGIKIHQSFQVLWVWFTVNIESPLLILYLCCGCMVMQLQLYIRWKGLHCIAMQKKITKKLSLTVFLSQASCAVSLSKISHHIEITGCSMLFSDRVICNVKRKYFAINKLLSYKITGLLTYRNAPHGVGTRAIITQYYCIFKLYLWALQWNGKAVLLL